MSTLNNSDTKHRLSKNVKQFDTIRREREIGRYRESHHNIVTENALQKLFLIDGRLNKGLSIHVGRMARGITPTPSVLIRFSCSTLMTHLIEVMGTTMK